MPTLSSVLTTQFVRELQTFIKEIEAFPSDDSVWHTRRGVTNSAGNLALHVCGNLQDFVGRVLGGTSYVRNRELEFSQREGTRASIVANLSATIDMIKATVPEIGDETMAADFPMQLAGKTLNTATFLVHLAAHLAFHLGQAGYLRRIITGDNTSTNPLPVAAISL
ncbi:MAG TPA: DinB family protein [Vicinamibacterales bacterium]|nr:DinB family protein [Vicinamibacterales bacterium]